jgi:predicted Rossmann-fold nucleotide-binding protein
MDQPLDHHQPRRILFAGSNEHNEVESLKEFYEKASPETPLLGWNFQAVDFSPMKKTEWDTYRWSGATFLGCTFPQGVTPGSCRDIGCHVFENPSGVPFVAFRAKMYTTLEMDSLDDEIGKYYRETDRKFSSRMAEAFHDFSMRDAMFDYLEGKIPVSIMGSHSLLRGSDHYAQLVKLARKLARAGFLIVTGGGNGAMEAANLGAYLANHTDEEMEEALQIIRTGNEGVEHEFLHPAPAQNVIKRFGWPTHMPSLGIPTWRYSQEPFNRFSTYHAKFFSNAQREDALCHIARAGIVFGQGGPGTRQEIFQACCINAEQHDLINRCPLIFLDSEFYKANGVYDVVKKNNPDQDVSITDDLDFVVQHLVDHANRSGLHLQTDFDYLKEE